MVGDTIYEKILDEIKKIKTSNDVKAIRDRLKGVEMLLELYREEMVRFQTDSVLELLKNSAESPEFVPAKATDVPW